MKTLGSEQQTSELIQKKKQLKHNCRTSMILGVNCKQSTGFRYQRIAKGFQKPFDIAIMALFSLGHIPGHSALVPFLTKTKISKAQTAFSNDYDVKQV